MYRSILVPLDGSPLAERALPYAQALAKASHGDVIIIRVVAPPRFPSEYHRLGRTNAMADAEEYLQSVIALGPSDVTMKAETFYDDPAMAIVKEVHRRPIDLVVMSTHGRAGLSGLIYGSVAEQVFRHVEIPALVVPPHCSGEWPIARRLKIVVPLDGSDLAAEVLPSAQHLAGVLDAELHALRVVTPPTFKHVVGYPDVVGVPHGVDVGQAEDYLETIASGKPGDGPAMTWEVVESTTTASAIATVAEEQGANAIAMSTHGRSGAARLVMGSIAAGLIQHATVPILLVRPLAMHHPSTQPQMVKSAPGIRASS